MTPSTTKIPVPTTLATSSTALPHPTQRALLLHLQTPPATTLPTLSALLTTSLHSTGWPDRVRALALELLRSGTCTTFPELLAEVLQRAKYPQPNNNTNNGNNDDHNNNNSKSTATNGKHAPSPTIILPSAASYGPDGYPDVRIPLKTVEEGVDFLKARVKDVVEVVEPMDEQGGSSDEE